MPEIQQAAVKSSTSRNHAGRREVSAVDSVNQSLKLGGIGAGSHPNASSNKFNPLRHYALSSFLSILIAAVLLTAFYRQIEVQETTEFARKSNLVLTEAVLDSVRQDLDEYLESVTNLGPQAVSNVQFPPALASNIAKLKEKSSIAKIKIYNKRGVVVFSTDRHEIGRVDIGDSGFASASKGQAVSDPSYRDDFSIFGERLVDDNMARTYVPVRLSPADPVLGALVTYADMSPAVTQNKRDVIAIIGGMALILTLLYAVLLLVVMRAKKIIDAQQDTIRERTAVLETLSVQLIASEEAEKLNLAVSLHDGLAQTLTAIKTRIEHSLERMSANRVRDDSLNTALAALQGAIEEVQEMAADLRPSSLDKLGLLPTIRWFCREFEYLHPDIRIEQQISAQEHEIPAMLKIVIYRIIEAVLKDIGNNAHRDRIRLSLKPNGNAIMLAIDDVPQYSASAETALGAGAHPRMRFAAAQERATLSGGAFSAAFNHEGGITLHASWAM